MQFRGRYLSCSIRAQSQEIDGLRYESAEAAFQGQKGIRSTRTCLPVT